VISFTPQPVYPRGKCHRYPLDRRLDGTWNRHVLSCLKGNVLRLKKNKNRHMKNTLGSKCKVPAFFIKQYKKCPIFLRIPGFLDFVHLSEF
jgi:hypothetical protein